MREVQADPSFRNIGNYAQFLHEICGDYEGANGEYMKAIDPANEPELGRPECCNCFRLDCNSCTFTVASTFAYLLSSYASMLDDWKEHKDVNKVNLGRFSLISSEHGLG